jgi:hypothetical protein
MVVMGSSRQGESFMFLTRWADLGSVPCNGGAAHRPDPGVVAQDHRHVIKAPPHRQAVGGRRRTRRE